MYQGLKLEYIKHLQYKYVPGPQTIYLHQRLQYHSQSTRSCCIYTRPMIYVSLYHKNLASSLKANTGDTNRLEPKTVDLF